MYFVADHCNPQPFHCNLFLSAPSNKDLGSKRILEGVEFSISVGIGLHHRNRRVREAHEED
jgi:hypothetical protein